MSGFCVECGAMTLDDARRCEGCSPPVASGESRGVPRGGLSWASVAVIVVTLTTLAAIFVPTHVTRRESPLSSTGCKSNLKNIGTALEMYSSDYGGHFPHRLAQLVPNSLKAIPTCPSTHRDTYSAGYSSSSKAGHEVYTVVCKGWQHSDSGYSANQPQYTSEQGLLER